MSEPIRVKRKYRKKKKKTHEGVYTLDKYGFREYSDSSKMVAIMLKGGLDRQDINEKISDTIDNITRTGKDKNIPSLVSGLLTRLQEMGFQVESSWRLVPPKTIKRK